ncbi:MAG: hypothetical protein Q9160_006089 [Pyrenula sp. 1 TL-2023]
MPSSVFNERHPPGWSLFTTVDDVRPRFHPSTSITIAIGGWGDTNGFSKAAATDKSRRLFAMNVERMLEETGADGVDIDWEYPGGNGEDYKRVPNSERMWEIDAYPKLLAAIRSALGPDKLISAAVPGLPRDMIAFTETTLPLISESVDFLNIMTYDLMNRRDNVTKHHTGIQLSLEAIDAYVRNGLSPGKANLGFAFYVKWFKTDPDSDCSRTPVGCRTALMEDPQTGEDLGKAGAFSWHDDVPSDLADSFSRAQLHGEYDDDQGGHYYWDPAENLWWSWDTPDAIANKFPGILNPRRLGGVFAWGLGEDANEWRYLRALTSHYHRWSEDSTPRWRDEL